MSKYTTNFRTLIEGNFVSREDIENIFKSYNLNDYLTQEEIDVISERGTWTPEKLATKIVDHYYLKDLGFETYSMFRHYALIEMKEIMESKLPLIYSASIKYDPMINVNYTEQFSRTIDNTGSDTSITNTTNNTNQTNSGTNNTTQNGSGSATSNGSGLTVNSDTPQGQISKETILGGSYASSTSAIENENTTTTTDSTTINNTTSDTLTNNNTINSNVNNSNTNNMQEGSTKTIKGNSGVSATSQKMILQYRENIRAIDKEIIEELNDLFMGLF